MTGEPRRRWSRVLAGFLSCLVLVGTAMAGVAGYYYNDLSSNITSITGPNWIKATDEPEPETGEPINILLMGSDTREGRDSKGYGHSSTIAGARSDTTILMHLSGDRTRALGVSIPRDSMVQLPTCKNAAGVTDGGKVARFNEAFDYGGPTCSVKAVEALTGVSIDHFMVVDFAGFKNVVNALDGVEVCLTKPVDDSKSKLHLKAGKSIVRGEQALAFVRARYSFRGGSDIGRIERQQEFLASAIRKATSVGVVANPVKLLRVLEASTKSLTADPGLASLDALKELAVNMQGIKPSDVTFATVPVEDNADGATLSWVPAQANQLWSAIKDDTPWPPLPTDGVDGQPLLVGPSDIAVNVLNGTGKAGAATRAAAQLREQGYNIGTISNTKKPVEQTTLQYNPANSKQAARTLEYAASAALAKSNSAGETLTLIIGPDYLMARQVVIGKQKASSPAAAAKPRTAATSICAS